MREALHSLGLRRLPLKSPFNNETLQPPASGRGFFAAGILPAKRLFSFSDKKTAEILFTVRLFCQPDMEYNAGRQMPLNSVATK